MEQIIKEVSEITKTKINIAQVNSYHQMIKFFELLELKELQDKYYIIEAKKIPQYYTFNYKYVLFRGTFTIFFDYISKSIKSQLENDLKNVCVICYENTSTLQCCEVCVSLLCLECYKKIQVDGRYNCPMCKS
jgi:hypothetical protein